MVRRGESRTLSADVYDTLRAELLSGTYPPGERLVPSDLCTRYEVKPGVLREALTRLAAEGLTTLEPNRGFRVMDVSRRGIEELLELRRINEGAALRLAVENGGTEYEAAVLAAMHVLASAATGPDRATAHRAFHLSLLSACPNDRLLELCESLFESSELYRQWSAAALRMPAERASRNQDNEHRAIMEAVLAHDSGKAVDLYLQHLQRTVDLALDYVATRES